MLEQLAQRGGRCQFREAFEDVLDEVQSNFNSGIRENVKNQKGGERRYEHEVLIFQNSESNLEGGILEETQETVTAIVSVHNPIFLFSRKLCKCMPSRAAELWETQVPVWNRGRDIFFNAQYTQYVRGI